MRGADHAVLNGGRGLDGQQFRKQRFIQATAELGQEFGQHEVRLGTVHLHLRDAAGIHHGQVGPQLATDLFIGTVQFMLE